LQFFISQESVNLQEQPRRKVRTAAKNRELLFAQSERLVRIVNLEILLIIWQQLQTRAAAVQETLKQAKPKFTPKE
jgi:hypothetical protein